MKLFLFWSFDLLSLFLWKKCMRSYSFNDTHSEKLVLYWIQYKTSLNTRLAASDVFCMFTESIKFF